MRGRCLALWAKRFSRRCGSRSCRLDVIAQRIQVSQLPVKGGPVNFTQWRGLSIARDIYRSEGLRGYYKGTGAFLLMYVGEQLPVTKPCCPVASAQPLHHSQQISPTPHLIKKEGVRALGKGLLPRLATTIPVMTVESVIYELALAINLKKRVQVQTTLGGNAVDDE